MERNHMLAPTSDGETVSSHDAVLGPPPARPPPSLMGFSPPAYSLNANALSTLSSATAIKFPDVPTTELPPPLSQPSHSDHDIKLPSLSAITAGAMARTDMAMNGVNGVNGHWAPLHPLPVYHGPPQPPHTIDSPTRMDLDASSNSAASAASPDRYLDGRASSVSLDDPDVRLAAEALGDLRADFVSSPPNRHSVLPMSPPTSHSFQQAKRTQPQSPQPHQPEPLLSLLTTSHPFLASTIEGATSAYGGAKNFSPRFKSGAEYVEGYITPIANTVGSVSRVTGVEGGVRWFLGSGRRQNSSSSDLETGNGKKRRKKDEGEPISNKRLEGEGMRHISGLQQLSGEAGLHQDPYSLNQRAGSRRLSLASTVDTLPAYDDARSPAYTETIDVQNSPRPGSASSGAAWQSRLIMSTSGLSVAMSDQSLRSLKYCLRWLKWANDHMERLSGALKTTLEQFEKAEGEIQLSEKDQQIPISDSLVENGQGQSRSELAARITSLKTDVLKTLQDVINTVSKYAGGALPENARILVRRHLTSLPQRFRVATLADKSLGNDPNSPSALKDGAHKVLVLAQEGLDMVVQISGVVDGTIVSAEEWCDRMGKRRRGPEDEKPVLPQTEFNGDVKMG